MALEDALFIGQFLFMIMSFTIVFYKLTTLGEDKEGFTWGFIFSNFLIVSLCYLVGRQLTMLQLDLTYSTIFWIEDLIFKVFIPMFIVSIFYKFKDLHKPKESYKPERY